MEKRTRVSESTALQVPEDVAIMPPADWMQPTALDLPEGMSFSEWGAIGRYLQHANRTLMWWIGDWALYGETQYGEQFAQAIEQYAAETVRNAQWVAERIPPEQRRSELSWTHHQAVVSLEAGRRVELLDRAVRENASRTTLREWVAAGRPVSTANRIAGEGGGVPSAPTAVHVPGAETRTPGEAQATNGNGAGRVSSPEQVVEQAGGQVGGGRSRVQELEEMIEADGVTIRDLRAEIVALARSDKDVVIRELSETNRVLNGRLRAEQTRASVAEQQARYWRARAHDGGEPSRQVEYSEA